jgi:hypothetical protein
MNNPRGGPAEKSPKQKKTVRFSARVRRRWTRMTAAVGPRISVGQKTLTVIGWVLSQ